MKPAPFFIGSLPYLEPEEAIRFVKAFSSHLPFLPQLPDANPTEDMIGQVLRGFQLGHWDERASICLELFQNEFGDAPRCKIQIAGPMAMARAMSLKFEQVVPQWLAFWEGLKTQLRQGAFRGELWLQIDEPFWSKSNGLPKSYDRFLEKIRNSRSQLRLGMHSCATDRPLEFGAVKELVEFYSFDYSKVPFTNEEASLWQELLTDKRTTLVYGAVTKEGVGTLPPTVTDFPDQLYLSAPCGLYDWTPSDIEKIYGKIQ